VAHNLFGERFYSHREQAWHGLGKVMEKTMTAVEAFNEVGAYDVGLRQLRYENDPMPVSPPDMIEAPGYRAIVRASMDGAGIRQFLGIAGPDYELVRPIEVCEIFDRAVGKPVETLGCLGNGETIFVTTKLPTIDVKGDEVENYIVAVGYFDGAHANRTMITPVRVVCQNTLVMGDYAATARLKIIHDGTLKARTEKWLKESYEGAVAKASLLKDAFDILANYRVKHDEIPLVIDAAFALPKVPAQNAPESVMKEREKAYEGAKELVLARRATATECFGGQGVGMDSPAAAGTAWGLYNACVEVADYSGRKDFESAARSALFGEWAEAMRRAFGACVSMTGLKNLN